MRLALVACVVACATAPAPLPPPPKATVAPVAPAAPPLDDATVKAKTHAFFDAWDRADLATVRDAVASAFVLFDHARFIDAGAFARGVQGRIDRHAAVRSRTWKDERVYASEASAIFIGEAIEHVPAEGERKAVDIDYWNTVVWARDGATWKVVHWQLQQGGLDAERELWNERFRQSIGFKLTANQTLIDAVKGRKPGAALDLAMGQGRNAIYLAKQGWRVTGVDISDEGIRIAKETAAKDKVKLDTIAADLDTWDLGKNRWELVTMIYAGDDAKLVERIKPSLKKGGLFVLEYFHKESDAAKAGAGGWETGALAKLFADGFRIVRDDVVDDIADYSLRQQKLVRFVAEKL
jgi:SAM-dependent methyltransferase